MRLWLILMASHTMLLLLDAAATSAASVNVESWDAVLQPWGLDLSDGLTVAEVTLNPRLYFSLLSRLLSWDYAVFAGTTVGVLIRSLLIGMTVGMFIYQAKGVAGSVSRFVPWIR